MCHLKNDLVTQTIQLFSEQLNPGFYFLQNYCVSIYIQSGLQFLLNYGVWFFPRSAKLGSGYLSVWVWVRVRFVNDATNNNKIDKTCFFFKLLLLLSIHKLAIKRGTFYFLSKTRSIKFEKSNSFIISRSVRLYT